MGNTDWYCHCKRGRTYILNGVFCCCCFGCGSFIILTSLDGFFFNCVPYKILSVVCQNIFELFLQFFRYGTTTQNCPLWNVLSVFCFSVFWFDRFVLSLAVSKMWSVQRPKIIIFIQSLILINFFISLDSL